MREMNAEEQGFSIINAFLQFSSMGAEWVMWLLIVLGFVMIILFFERLVLYLSTRIDAPSLARELLGHLEGNKIDEARARVKRGQAMEERVLADALEAYDRGSHVVEQVILSSLARERQRYERFLAYFGTLGNNAPFIGLFGTVIGIIIAFRELGANPKGGLEVVGPGIAEALVATAVGLLVAIPAVVAFNFFKGLLKERASNTDFLGRIVLARLKYEEER
ncbi:MAG: MotA/TolQ/ExbB proton channel family protein [Myxococcales bacterium]|nr:MotA/TolQ/ExbB proton channel family protein [Myxococcales bacterium]